ncbi:GH3 auxin-responsive promoter [Corchorus olitorius]|uniref:GH3 auxin-responsive promoter n=1 Tax=Corchorus olitorius TaxID=93759 RepID=A0A1R3KD14_9ROSI|nr:GH3 auxin-responsive promoter [Corchorus olitorius]
MADDSLRKQIEESTKDAARYQAETLQSILQHQRGVRYLQRHLCGIDDHNARIDAATFRRSVPLSSYDDYADYINQLANGVSTEDHDHRHLLSADPLVCFFYSAFKGGVPHSSSRKWGCSSKGSSNVNRSLFMSLTSPKEVIMGSNVEHQMYCHILCGLRNSDSVDSIHAPYALGLIKAFRVLESKWEQLCGDIENGFPSLDINDVPMRDSVIEVLGGPQPELSSRIRLICEEKDWGGILQKLWPNVRYIRCVTTGSMKQYYSKLKYYAGEVPLLGGDYFSSECCVAINLDIKQPPNMTRFVMLPTAAYFEFLPFDSTKNQVVSEETVDIRGVEVGKMYEVVVTTYRGFYRYRLGDIVRVVDFYNTSPLLEFVMRAPKTRYEIVTEGDLMAAFESLERNSIMSITMEIVEFSSFFNFDSSPKRLKVFFEVKDYDMFSQNKLEELKALLKECCSVLEDGLGSVYKVQRDKGEIHPLSLSILKCGSFDKLQQEAINNGAPASQYKPPKIIRNRDVVNVLEEYVLANYDQL